MRTAKRILAEFMTVVMVLQACSPTVAAVAAGWQNISSEIATAAAEASDAAESGETKSDVTTGSGSSDTGAAGDSAQDGAAKDDAAAGDTSDSAAGSDSAGDQTEGDDTAGDAAADDAEQNADTEASEDAAAQANATITNLDDLVKLLKKNGAQNIDLKEDNSGIKSFEVTNSAAFAILSNANAQFYHDAQIGINFTGDLPDLTSKDESKTLSFQGLGSDAHPFDGKIYDVKATGGNGSVELKTDRTVFNSLKLTGQNNTVKIKWVGATNYNEPMVASKISGENMTLNATVDIADSVGTDTSNDKTSALTAPLLGETTGDLTVDVTYRLTGSRKGLNVSAAGNVGLLANTVKSGTFAVESVAFPDDLAKDGVVKTSSGNAGLLVGTVEDGATLSVGTLPNVPTATVQSTNGSAGGVVGLVGSNTGATVNVTKPLSLQTLTVKGTTASGGLIGKATNLTLDIADGVTVKPACNVGDKDSACSGGVIGDVSFARKFTVKPNMFDLGDGVTLSATQRAGALFGVADISAGDIVVQGGTYKSKLTLPENVSVNGSYGGLAGKVFATTKGVDEMRAFVVQKDPNQKDENQNRCTIEFNLAGGMSDAGGAVGYVGDSTLSNSQPVAVVLDGVTVACKGDASARTNTGKFGGAAGVVDKRNVLDVRDFKLTSDNPIGKAQSNRAAGIAGSAWNAVIKFSGITDLSGASFAENGTTGQLIYDNDNALIFAVGNGSNGELTDKGAAGWTFKRSNTASKTDDIATYGEVIRLGGDFIKLDADTHKLTLPDSLTAANGVYTLTSVEDFAKLAITWQTNGYYSMVDGVTENNLNGLQSSTITVNDTIDLKGTGLTGFTRDRASDSQIFSGTLNGNGTINLAVGEVYGKRGEDVLDGNNTSSGNGKIYRHGRLGLFAAIKGTKAPNASNASDVTIAGFMKFDNGSAIDAGSLAGTIVGTKDEKLTLSGITCGANITCDDTFGNDVNIGGIAGSVTAAATVEFNNSTKAQATINTGGACCGNTRIGGAIGYVGDVAAIFTVTDLQVGGSIGVDASATADKTFDEKSSKIVQTGGFIGTITQGTAKNTTKVKITGLSFNSFNMAVGKSGDRRDGAGGLLGYSWGNAIVTIGDAAVNTSDSTYALKSSNKTTVTANSSTEVGGLVYAASGQWTINDYAIDLSNATINADKATVLGLLIGRGGRTENSTTYGVETYSGLYLENRASWDTAYKVNGATADSGVKINNTAIKSSGSATSFDEWVGNSRRPSYGTKAGSKLIDGEWNAVVSLHTKDDINGGKLDMSGNPGSDNSYHNRSVFGKEHNTNAWTRYYYNLDKAYAAVGNNKKNSSASSWMDSPEYLLLWCAYLYAPPAIQSYIIPGNREIFKGNKIGTENPEGATIDLKGYSFYPTNPASGSTVTVNNATITFHYSDIKAGQEGNKKNSEATQHENMHCALIRTHAGNLKVKNVTLAGTVGSVVNDAGSSSGALVCRYIYGPINKTNVAQLEIDGLTLDGLTVDGVNGNTSYAPLLINEMQTCVNLSAKDISTTGYANGMTAATSLFGKLGVGKNADQVTATFNRISVPSATGQDATDKSIFTRASLLESFGYGEGKTGSAVYTFLKDDQDKNKVTFGREIDSTDGEYPGKQLWYYDEETYGAEKGFVKVKDELTDAERPWFSDYLPYVAKRKTNENGVQYHEIMVNQRISNLTTGCGTYGDPYVIASASELNAAANYINNGTALDGWEVTIAKEQSTLCQRRNGGSHDNEVTYVYKQANDAAKRWEKKNGETTDPTQTLADETMRRYVQSAYYSIEPVEGNKITLDAASFGGFGNKANPFRGVIVGDLGPSEPATIEIKNNKGGLRGFIPYSYGSVVRNLNINYVNAQETINAQATVTYSPKDTDGVPAAFFGGVIGCILGGDNIIDGVAVGSNGFTVTGGGDKPHLVPIGGYVGAIAGGGVIFRNMKENSSWRAGTSDKSRGLGKGNFDLYDNPYVGRVIDGYAFSEGRVNVDNGDANYKINKLEKKGTSCVTATSASDNTTVRVTPTSAQGLLVLSAIINSGAASGGVSLAYEAGAYDTKTSYKFGNARYGKVRNATYEHVGNPASVADDFKRSIADDQTAPGFTADGLNLPYLVNSYADAATGSLCASLGVELQLASNEPYNMTSYGRGFTGLSGRYVSNACASSKGVDRDCIVPRIACINGNGRTIKVGSKDENKVYGVTEYVDDNYKVAGVGALFSTVMFTSTNVGPSVTANDGAQVRDLTFSNCNVALTYIDANGNITSGQSSSDLIGTGLLAGATANYDGGTCGIYRNVQMKNCTVSGAKSVGGLLGSSGRASRSTDSDVTYMVKFSSTGAPAYLYDCSYTGLCVTGEKYVGGYVGTVASACGVWTTAAKGVSEKTVGENSTITATGTIPNVGGVLGYADLSNISVNTNIGTTAAVRSCTAVLSGVNVLATGKNTYEYMGAGGVAGCARGGIISMSNVRVDAGNGTENVIIGGIDGANNGIRNVGGLFGRVTSSPYKPNKYWFEDCSVKHVNFAGINQCSGGLIGYYHSDLGIACNNITIEGATIGGDRSGGLLGMIHNGVDVIDVTNTKVSTTTFSGTSNGGIAGDGRGQFHLVNVLMDSNTYKSGVKQGVLLGKVDTGDNKYSLSAAGVNVRPGNGKTTSDLPPMVYTDNTTAVNKKTYIAFGYYNDKLAVPGEGTTLYGAGDAATTAVSPYVTTSPVSTLAVRASDGDTTDRYLFGDGAAVATAAAIQKEAGESVRGRYTYTNICGINDDGVYQNKSSYDASSVKSTFNANNDASGNKVTKDFPVLVISGKDNTTVTSYLNIITNGGFSDACRLNNENGTNAHVTAKAEVFQLKNGVFVKDDGASSDPTLRVVNNGKKNMSFSPSADWDNGKGRFTLLTVTFTEAGQNYNVQVPIIVKRKLEIDFSATYDYGTNFKEGNYANLGDGAHVLTSFGEPMTGLLTWTYNSANGKEVDFGWDSYMAAGGSMKGLGKSICFEGSRGTLPQGTQLTLVDANVDGKAGGREYHYEVGEGGASSVSLSGNDGFKDSSDPAKAYQERWLSEILGVSAKQDNDGTWAVCDSEADATAKAKLGDTWKLFKVAGADVSSDKRYTLTVPKDDNGKEQRASESVYLVVNVPKPSVDGARANINGFTGASIDSGSSGNRISWSLHHVLRANGHNDSHNNTASTYGILSNYGQEVNDGKSEARTPVSKSTDGAAYVLSLDVTDTVTFNPSQNYADSDSLFYQLDTSLCKYGTNGNLTGVSSFPSGTSAIAKFYVAIGDRNYRWNGDNWETCDASTPAFTQTVMDTGDDSLKLTLDHDLAGIRKSATGGSFTVRTVVEEIRLTPDGCNKVIALSQQSGEDAYTKMSYTAKLSTRKEGLNTSSLTQTKRGYVGYYRMDKGDATITLSAPEKSQLGINVDDLRPIANGTIGLGATYELGGLNNATETIKNADSVVYTLTLQRRSGTDGSYEDVTDGISNYVTVTESKLATVSDTGNAITFTDTKKDGAFGTKNGDTTFNLPFTVKVNTQAEQSEQFYANYRLVMTASLVTGDVASAMPQSPDYVTYTLTRVSLNGIDH